jgi:tRNA(Ile)-lysidine synthase
MEATVLPLTWPEDFDPNDLKRFETEARTLRYQALGRACRDLKITSLMVAHHADDQAETVMMRLANNRLRSGLQAMQSIEWIPECEGIYGVYHSGKSQKPDISLNIPFPVEQGGIQILRPLLHLEKARLIATCKEKEVAWAEDQTNAIHTLTSRNAIRHIYKTNKLPEALSINSLLDVSLKMQERIKWHRTHAKKLFDQTLIKLDIQTGCLIVRFPPFSSLLPRPIETKTDKIQAKNTAYCLVERVAELVTSRSKAPLSQLAGTIDRIYPELEELDDGDLGHWEQVRKRNYCVYSVWWRFWDQPTPFPEHKEDGIDLAVPHPREWLLTRQPLDTVERMDPGRHIVYPASSSPSLAANRRSPYRLFDGRFWIRLANLSSDTLVLRVFQKSDFRHFPTYQQNKDKVHDSDSGRPYRFLSAAFDLLKPVDLRFTLPAVFRKDAATGEESLIGFPTLDVRIDGFGAPEGVCEWNVRYKKIDFGNRGPGDIIVPGSSRKDITAEERRQRASHQGVLKVKLLNQAAYMEKRGKKVKETRGGYKGSDVFTGFKVVGKEHVDGRDRRRKRMEAEGASVPRGMQGEETDGLGFLEEESRKQERGGSIVVKMGEDG